MKGFGLSPVSDYAEFVHRLVWIIAQKMWIPFIVVTPQSRVYGQWLARQWGVPFSRLRQPGMDRREVGCYSDLRKRTPLRRRP